MSMRKGWKWFWWVVAVVLLVGVLLRLSLPSIVVAVANSQLSKQLKAEASIGGVELNLHRGRVSVRDIQIGQPPGFGGPALLNIPLLSVEVSPGSLLKRRPRVRYVRIEKPEIYLAKRKDGILNAQVVAPQPAREPEAEPLTEEPAQVSARIDEIRVDDAKIVYVDDALSEEAVQIHLSDLDLLATGLVLGPGEEAAGEELPGKVRMTCKVLQDPRGPAYVGAFARTGVMGGDVPAVNAALRMIGFELDLLGSVVPPGVRQALGSPCPDIHVDLAMAPDMLDCTASVVTPAQTMTLRIGGTPAKPKPDTSSALFAVWSRLGGGLGSAAMNLGQAGVKAADAAVGAVGEAGKGAAKAVTSAGKGLYTTLKGATHGDLKAVGEGLKQTTIDTVKETAVAVGGTAEALVTGAGEVVKTGVGAEQTSTWRASVRARWEEAWNAAQQKVHGMPFPRPAGTKPTGTGD